MNQSAMNVFSAFIENTDDTPEAVSFDEMLHAVLTQTNGKPFAENVRELLWDMIYEERRLAFAAGMKSGMEITAFIQKGAMV